MRRAPRRAYGLSKAAIASAALEHLHPRVEFYRMRACPHLAEMINQHEYALRRGLEHACVERVALNAFELVHVNRASD